MVADTERNDVVFASPDVSKYGGTAISSFLGPLAVLAEEREIKTLQINSSGFLSAELQLISPPKPPSERSHCFPPSNSLSLLCRGLKK